ncbi:hypothetical protein GF361_00940 [Candidatus Woesearchaeota archaeon]|nr:hypothetical protein [Candidatus Woesearchaeota archaeon]
MKILTFVDLHGNKKTLRKLVKRAKKKDIDLVICAGDFTIFGEEQKDILSELDKAKKPVLIIHGNHEEAKEVRKDCKKLDNCNFIYRKKFRKNGYLFIGWGGGGFDFKDKKFEKYFKKLKTKKEDKIVLISHAPPYDTKIDKIGKEHAGNKSIRKFIKKFEPVLAVSGHLHECVGEDRIGKTRIVNPGYKGKIITI